MGYYTHFNDYADKFALLAGRRTRPGREHVSTRAKARRRIKRIDTEIERLLKSYVPKVLSRSKQMLQRDVYTRYIPTKDEYRDKDTKKGKHGTKGTVTEANRLHRRRLRAAGVLFSGFDPSNPMIGHPTRKDRAWQRTGQLMNAETAFVERPGGPLGKYALVLQNNARNRKNQSQYAEPRRNLGTPGHRQNTAWTLSTQWHEKAFAAIKPNFDRDAEAILQELLDQ